MSNDNRSGAAPSAQKSHADIIAEMRKFTEQRLMLMDAMRGVGKFADCLEAAHTRELDAKDSVIQSLRAELRLVPAKREINLATQKAKAAAEGYEAGYLAAQVGNEAELREVATIEKSSAVGDCAKLREALATIRKRLVAAYESEACFMRYSPNKPLVDLIDAALAAPPRNCDRFATAEEARQAWLDDAGNWDEFGSQKLEPHEWLYAPATEKEGGNNGNE